MPEIFLYPIVFLTVLLLSYLGVEWFRRWSLRRALLDIPNERSSHTAPTPRGGGLIVVILSLLAYLIHAILTTGTVAWAYVLGAIMIAAVSWLDDLYSVSFLWRILIHAFAAALVIFFIGYFEEFYIPLVRQTAGGETVGILITFLGIVWLTNAYNFMDGIDGIAGMQSVTAGIGWLLIGQMLGLPTSSFYGGVIAFAGFGFLIQNWQPAKIFMGDVGSAFLGFTLAVLPLLSYQETSSIETRRLLPSIAVALNWLFIFDTIFTVTRRLFKREKIWEAHRGHLYQKMVVAGFAHQTITIFYGALAILTVSETIFWLIETNFFRELILVTTIILQSFGLLFYVWKIHDKDRGR